jgi:cellulose biosynthesis protein BcsQ
LQEHGEGKLLLQNNQSFKKNLIHFGDKVFKTHIRENISLEETPSFGKTIFEYKLDSHGERII